MIAVKKQGKYAVAAGVLNVLLD